MSTDAVITFAPDCTFTGQPTFAGDYSWNGKSLAISNTTGQDMTCHYTDTFAVTFSADCSTATLAGTGSGCTGARRYLDWSVTLTR